MVQPDNPVIHFRRLIASRYAVVIRVTVGNMAAALGLGLITGNHPFLRSLLSAWFVAGLMHLLYILHRREEMLSFFRDAGGGALRSLEMFLEKTLSRWEQSTWMRLVVGTALLAPMLILLIFFKESRWGWHLAGIFVMYILSVVVFSWLKFREQILLHDIRRALRDQAS